MSSLSLNRSKMAGDHVSSTKLELRSVGRVCWADLSDDQTTDPGDSPRSMASSIAEPFEDHEIPKRTAWADMEDSESESDSLVPTRSLPEASKDLHFSKGSGKGKNAGKIDNSVSDHELVRGKGARKGWVQRGGHEKYSKGDVPVKGSGKGKDAGKAGKGWQQRGGQGGKKGAGKGIDKFQCQFFLDIEEDPKFKVVKRVLGTAGANMKRIAEESGAKLRLRGRGSKFLEGPEKKESEDDLMLCISSEDARGFEIAKKEVSELIEMIHQHYQTFCRKAGHPCPVLEVRMHEGYRPGSR